MNDSQEIAILIKSIAKSKKITIKQMLSDCQLSVNTLSSMQAGGYYPRLDAIYKLSDYLDVSIYYLLGRTDKPEVNREILTENGIYKDNDRICGGDRCLRDSSAEKRG